MKYKMSLLSFIFNIILFLLYTIFAFFVVGIKKTDVFICSYFFTVVIMAVSSAWLELRRSKSAVGQAYLKMPIAIVLNGYCAIQIIISLLIMTFAAKVSLRFVLVTEASLFLVTAAVVIVLRHQEEYISGLEEKTENAVTSLRELERTVDFLISMADTEKKKRILYVLKDELHFSIPKQSEQLSEIETEIYQILDEISHDCKLGEQNSMEQKCKKAIALLKTRNDLCRTL